MIPTPIVDTLQKKIDMWFEGDDRDDEKLFELYLQLRMMEREGKILERTPR